MAPPGCGTSFLFYLARDVVLPFKFKIDRLESIRLPFDDEDPFKMLYMTSQIYDGDIPLCGMATASFQSYEDTTVWNQWLYFTIKYQDLPLTASLSIQVWDAHGPGKKKIIGEARVPIFNLDNRQVKQGNEKIRLIPVGGSTESVVSPSTSLKELERLEKLMKEYESNRMPKVEWLDRKVKAEMSRIKRKAMEGCGGEMFLHLEFPTFENPVYFYQTFTPPSLPPNLTINEPFLVRDAQHEQNPVEMKYLKLAHRSNIYDKDLKPDQSERLRIDSIVSYPPHRPLNISEKELIWKFRYFVSQNPQVLPKFLQCIDWKDPQNVSSGVEMLEVWEPMDPTGALELLSKQFKHIEVRKYAVRRLDAASDEELLCYLLQLVQAIGHERTGETPLTNFLITRACKNFELSSYLHWYLTVESEMEDNRSKCFKKKLRLFHLALSSENDSYFKQIKRGEELVKTLTAIQTQIRRLPHKRPKKIEMLKDWLTEKGHFSTLYRMQDLPLPLDPLKCAIGVNPDKATIFKSAMAPLGIDFALHDEENYKVLFKSGDDLRQDQFIVQLITLMDQLLKAENLDLQLTPYRVLATSHTEGLLECVTPSVSIAKVLQDEGNIQRYLRSHHGDYDRILDNFVRSCAGYCVITYILGIGDRHLDNLLITPTGKLFHIDFGFILGKDPKHFPPPMKLCKEMVEGMGGATSEHYHKFKEHCCEAFNILRKSSNLILNLFQLMLESNIPDISDEPEKSILKVQEKLRLELNDEEASKAFQVLINESVSALFPQITEVVHRWAQYWRS